MDINFNCVKCGQNIAIDEAGAGQLVDCPECATALEVPYRSKPLNVPLAPALVAPPKVMSTKPSATAATPRKQKGKAKKILIATILVFALTSVLFFGRSALRKDRSPLGKTEQQVDRLYGEPVKVEGSKRTYLLGDIIAGVDFFSYGGKSRAAFVFFYKDSPVSLVPNRITLQEAQRLMRELSGGGRWTIEQEDSRHSSHDTTHYVYREKSLRLVYRKLRYLTVKELNASYDENYGMLHVYGGGFGDMFSIHDAFAAEPLPEPASSAAVAPSSTNALTQSESDKLAVLDAKNGFRDYKLGGRIEEFSGLRQVRSTVDETSYEVQDFDKALGVFELAGITLTFQSGLLREIEIKAEGEQNAAGLQQTLIEAYGHQYHVEASGLGLTYEWNGNNVELRFSKFYRTAYAKFTSEKVDAKLRDDREKKVKEAAPEAAKQL